MIHPVLRTYDLHKNYGRLTAVDHLNLSVPAGSIFGILGPNGSGKTTTLGMLVDIIKPSSGYFEWFGQKPDGAIRKSIGAIVETPNFYPYLTARQNMKIICDIKGQAYAEIDKSLTLTELGARQNSRYKTFSLGMKQRLAIAAAMIGKPRVLILDEPTNGLDPKGIAEIRNIIRNIASEGITILLASHLLDEVQKVCTHVAILDHGKILSKGPVEDVLSDSPLVELAAPDMPQLKSLLEKENWVKKFQEDQGRFVATLKEGFKVEDVNRELVAKGIFLNHIMVRKKSLENYFLETLEANA
ncbi:MAG: ATP-binding cassette domain-containing protein [Bacteroidales bacterium]|nr:ATP-binding cassette domain-containing protein [Bacteroidales bacterium]MCF8396914.1 ATP-binding cassette domain-containing protein [Bacteroidales bacterium]